MLSGAPVLVTGGSGFVGAHCVAELLGLGYSVRATVRSPEKESLVRHLVEEAGVDAGDRLTVVVADLLEDDGWDEAMEGVERVLHLASAGDEGAIRVLTAANEAGVRRVVLTSSFAAIGYGHRERDRLFTEADWSDVDAGVTPYVRSKTLAERAAWEYVDRIDVTVELTVINPTGIFGPVLGDDLSSSVLVIRQLLAGDLPRVPKLSFGIVDVRDVADLHVRAMDHPAAAGQRFIATAGVRSLREVAATLRKNLDGAAAKVPTRTMPSFAVRAAAIVNANARRAVPDLGVVRRATSEKAQRVLGWLPRSPEEAVVATAESLLSRR